MSNFYCGLKPTKGKRLGTPEECYKAKQIRYYGLQEVDLDKLAENVKGLNINEELQKAQIKFRRLQDNAKELLKNYKNLKVKVDERSERGAKTKTLNKQMTQLLKKRDMLIDKIKKQKEVVNELIEAKKEIDKTQKIKKKPKQITKKDYKEIIELQKEFDRLKRKSRKYGL